MTVNMIMTLTKNKIQNRFFSDLYVTKIVFTADLPKTEIRSFS